MGRKALDGEPAELRLVIRVTARQLAILTFKADGRDLSTWAREILLSQPNPKPKRKPKA